MRQCPTKKYCPGACERSRAPAKEPGIWQQKALEKTLTIEKLISQNDIKCQHFNPEA